MLDVRSGSLLALQLQRCVWKRGEKPSTSREEEEGSHDNSVWHCVEYEV